MTLLHNYQALNPLYDDDTFTLHSVCWIFRRRYVLLVVVVLCGFFRGWLTVVTVARPDLLLRSLGCKRLHDYKAAALSLS